MNRTSRTLLRQALRPCPRRAHVGGFSQIASVKQEVQTPAQSQHKTNIPPELRPAEGTSVQTPVQSQDPGAVTPNPTGSSPRQRRDLLPFYTLFGGLGLGSVFVYYYYLHRKEHMQKKWENMIREAQEARKGSG